MEDEDYEFDYEDSDQDQDDGQVDMENEYYTAKGHLQDGKLQSRRNQAALDGFKKVLEMQTDARGEWGSISPVGLRICYAMSGHDVGHDDTRLQGA
eukprot:1537073-Rhodomonas_salina.2